MILVEWSDDRVRVGWPKFLGYARVGSVAILNVLGIHYRRVGPFRAVSIG